MEALHSQIENIPETVYAQIANGTIDPNWVMVCILAVVSFLLIRILNRIDKKLDAHDLKLEDHEVRLTVIEKR